MLKRGMAPAHPGEILKEMYIEPIGMTITDFADHVHVTRKNMSQIINGHTGISAEMAQRLAKAFDTSPQFWMNLQQTYDLWNTEPKDLATIQSIKTWKPGRRATAASSRRSRVAVPPPKSRTAAAQLKP